MYVGAHQHLIGPLTKTPLFHGVDGFGDLEHDSEPDVSIVKKEHAAVAISNIVNKNPKAISIMNLGPLTNTALALKLSRQVKDNIKDIWIMGGNYTGKGI